MKPLGTFKNEQKAKLLAANEIVKKQVKIIIFLQDQLACVQDKQT